MKSGAKKSPGGGGVLRIRGYMKPPNPYLSLRVQFWRKRVPKGVFSQENDVFVYFSTKWAKILVSSKITNVGGMFKEAQKPYPMFKDFSQKSDILERQSPCLTPRVPPPPPPLPPGEKKLHF